MDDIHACPVRGDARQRFGISAERARLDGLITALSASVNLMETERTGFTDPAILRALDLMMRAASLTLEAAIEKRAGLIAVELCADVLADVARLPRRYS